MKTSRKAEFTTGGGLKDLIGGFASRLVRNHRIDPSKQQIEELMTSISGSSMEGQMLRGSRFAALTGTDERINGHELLEKILASSTPVEAFREVDMRDVSVVGNIVVPPDSFVNLPAKSFIHASSMVDWMGDGGSAYDKALIIAMSRVNPDYLEPINGNVISLLQPDGKVFFIARDGGHRVAAARLREDALDLDRNPDNITNPVRVTGRITVYATNDNMMN